jgi:hypothetical protein
VEVKEFNLQVYVNIDGRFYQSQQRVTGDTSIKLVKQMLKEAYDKVYSQIEAKYPDKDKCLELTSTKLR